jgi:SAM-dependent methyltransferase
MLGGRRANSGVVLKQQSDDGTIPFPDESFDFVTAVCVYHHVPRASRAQLTAEVHRVLKPGGTLAIIEHNPFNPITRLIVSRTPVDADAVLLRSAETRRLIGNADFALNEQTYFLYFPERIYSKLSGVETVLRRLPLGGQYAVFATKRL